MNRDRSDRISNRLHFLSNSKTILHYLKSKSDGRDAPPQFSLNSIKSMPDPLYLPINRFVMSLVLHNTALPTLDEATRDLVLSRLFPENPGKQPEKTIQNEIAAIRHTMKQSVPSDPSDIDVFERAVANYEQFRFFCHYDWRLTHWGTVEDIRSVEAETFERPTRCIVFETYWTPPIAALQILSNTFPSVRFKLEYRHHPHDPWTEVEFFPFPPFGY